MALGHLGQGGIVTVPMTSPSGLHVIERPVADSAHTVVLVHGSLDRAESFARVMRRLSDVTTVAYDRRGYQQSRGVGVAASISTHVDDLLGVIREITLRTSTTVSAVGHSLGGDVVIAAALAHPDAFASIGAFEPPMPWLGFRRHDPGSPGPAAGRQWPRTPDSRPSDSLVAWSARGRGVGSAMRAGPPGAPTGRRWWPT